ncbi:MAG: hypothetical protein Q4E35_09255 [Eubacteriales bacterium]|nr:hypothetical protein [Eubacteriales bacterium]
MGILKQSYLDNMEMMGKIFLKAKKTIDHLEGEAFYNAWEELKWEYQRKCAEEAMDTLIQHHGGSQERLSQYLQDRFVPGVDGQTEYLIQFMYPDYVYCVLYYILTGKKAAPKDAIFIDEDLKHMVNTWTRMWETNYKAGEPLYMGTNQAPMYYE